METAVIKVLENVQARVSTGIGLCVLYHFAPSFLVCKCVLNTWVSFFLSRPLINWQVLKLR